MKETKLIGENNKEVYPSDRTFPAFKKEDMTYCVYFYEKNNYNDAVKLYNCLNKASEAFRLKIAEPE